MVFFSRNSVPTLQNQVVRTESYYFACGGLADLFRGQWNRKPDEHIPVVIKLIRRCTWSNKAAAERARQVWIQLHHPHIVPFYGLIFERGYPGLVMPYYKNGDLLNFLRKNPQANKLDLICEVATGLDYLHNLKPHGVVHGDVKASNVLVSDNHQACLTDFGMAKMLAVSGFTTTAPGGTCRWMSPELLDELELRPTTASDVWAFGMTILQIFTGKLPFDDLRNDATVVISIARGSLPSQPSQIDDSMWRLLKRCWASEPSERPRISTLSVILNIMSRQRLTPTEVDDLVDYLENQQPSPLQEGSTSPGVSDDPQATPSRKLEKSSLFRTLRRRLSLDPEIARGSAPGSEKKPFLGPLRRRSADPGPLETSPTTGNAGHHAFHCSWPDCQGYFTGLYALQAHTAQHWLSWEDDNEDLDISTRVMPGISSLLE